MIVKFPRYQPCKPTARCCATVSRPYQAEKERKEKRHGRGGVFPGIRTQGPCISDHAPARPQFSVLVGSLGRVPGSKVNGKRRWNVSAGWRWGLNASVSKLVCQRGATRVRLPLARGSLGNILLCQATNRRHSLQVDSTPWYSHAVAALVLIDHLLF